MVDLSKMTKWDMGKLFDFSVLPKQSTEADIRRGCQIAKEYNCKAFCFSSSEWTPIVAEELKGTDIMVGAAIGFPFGQQSSAVKAFETAEAVRLGATVLDNCMNVGDLKDKKYDIIIANINRNILLNDMETYVSCLNKNGLLFLSGFYNDDIPVIQEACEAYLLKFDEKLERNQWVALKFLN